MIGRALNDMTKSPSRKLILVVMGQRFSGVKIRWVGQCVNSKIYSSGNGMEVYWVEDKMIWKTSQLGSLLRW